MPAWTPSCTDLKRDTNVICKHRLHREGLDWIEQRTVALDRFVRVFPETMKE